MTRQNKSSSGNIFSSFQVNSCGMKPCMNGGTCVVTGERGDNYTCICDNRHRGNHCEHPNNTDRHADLAPDHHSASAGRRVAERTTESAVTTGSCFYRGRIHGHGARWDTLEDCRQCSCIRVSKLIQNSVSILYLKGSLDKE